MKLPATPFETPESDERFRTVFEESPVGNKIIDKDLNILQINMAMVKLLGYDTKEELVGTKILDYTPEPYRKDWAFLQQQLWSRNSNSFTLESAMTRRDGNLIHCRITSILFKDKDETLGYTTIEDISDQYLLRQQKEEFISVASHELKTPVTSLKASVQMLYKVIQSGITDAEKLLKLANSASLGVNRLMHLVDDLLSTTRLEQGQLSMNKGRFKIGSVLDMCCDHVELGGNYYITFQGDRELSVFGDQYKIEQVVVNMINNAIKYVPRSKGIILKAESKDNQVRISIIDHGEGISDLEKTHLFERYYRVQNETTQRSGGLGLGLYISAEIIKRHGGDIGVENGANGGSCFWFTLPVE